MEKRAGRKLISYIVVFCQLLSWSQASFAAGSSEALSKAAAAAASALGAVDNEATLQTATTITNQFGSWYKLPQNISYNGKPLGGVFLGGIKPGAAGSYAAAGEFAVPIMTKAGEVIGQIGLPAKQKINAVSKLRQLVMKGGKFTLMDFPMEAFTFFVALGALSKIQLSSAFADDPVSWQQHLMAHDLTTAEGRMGYTSFFAFMLASRGCGVPLHLMAGKSTKMLPWISYMEMACGFVASNIVQEASRFPELEQCVASLETRAKQEDDKWSSCERAYDSWSDVGWEKAQQWTPSLVAMVLSTGMSGFAEKAVVSLGKKTAFNSLFILSKWQVAFDPAMKLASWFTPGVGGLRIIRFIYKVGQFMAFTKTQEVIEPDIKQFFSNLWDGFDLRTLETDIMYQLNEKKKSGWKDPVPRTYGDLNLSLTKLPQLAMEWRKGSMAELIARHQNWMQYVSNFSQTYTAAMLFYDHYINEYRNRYISRQPSLLNAPFLLSGIEPTMPEQGPQPNEYYGKTDYEYRQVRTLIEARQKMEELLKANEVGIQRNYPGYLPEVRKFLALLPTADDFKNGKLNYGQYATALEFMNQQLGITFDPGAPWSKMSPAEMQMKAQAAQAELQAIAQSDDLSANQKKERTAKIQKELLETLAAGTNNNKSFDDDGRYLYSEFRKMLGNPIPLRLAGIGFLKSYEESTTDKNNLSGMIYPTTEIQTDRLNNSGMNSVYSGVNNVLSFMEFVDKDSTPYTTRSNTINYLHPSQYLAAQIALGPRADQKQPLVVMSKSGFPARFSPPRLVDSYAYNFLFDETKKVTSDSRPTIFNTPVLVGPTKVKYPNLYTILMAPTVLPAILNHKDGFAGWWKDYVEAQYTYAWNKFENEYQEIMVGMLEHYKYANPGISFDTFGTWIQTARRNGLSTSPLSGGLQLAFRQERRLHLLVLGEMLKDMASALPKDSPLLKLGQANPAFNASEHPLKFASISEAMDDKNFVIACSDQFPGESQKQTACVKKMKRDKMNGLSAGKGIVEVLATGSTKEWDQNLKPFVPVLEILKSSEQYSLTSILDGYKGQINHGFKDSYAKNHFAFQDQIERAFYDLEYLMDQMQLVDVDSPQFRMATANGVMEFPLTSKVVVSKVTNQQLRDAQTKIENLVNQLQEQFKQAFEKANPEVLPIILADMRGLKTVANQTAEIGRMINAVSYVRSDEKARQKGESICDTNTMITNKVGILGNRTPFTRKACDNMAKREQPLFPAQAGQQKAVVADHKDSQASAETVTGEASNADTAQPTAPVESAKPSNSLNYEQPEFEKELFKQNSPSKGDQQPVLYIKDESPSN